MTLTQEQREAREAAQEEYLAARRATNPKNEYEYVILEADCTISFYEGDWRDGGMVLGRKWNNTGKPYWVAVRDKLDNIEITNREYATVIYKMLNANSFDTQLLCDLDVVITHFGNVYDKIDEKIFAKKVKDKTLKEYADLFEGYLKTIDEALLFSQCKMYDAKSKTYSEMPAEERLKLITKKLYSIKNELTQKVKDNKNECADRSI